MNYTSHRHLENVSSILILPSTKKLWHEETEVYLKMDRVTLSQKIEGTILGRESQV
jgi:hypothetical protein